MVSQGDANRSYSDEDQSLSNMEEFDKLQEGLDSSGGKQTSTCHLGARTLPKRSRWAKGTAPGFPSSPGSVTAHFYGLLFTSIIERMPS